MKKHFISFSWFLITLLSIIFSTGFYGANSSAEPLGTVTTPQPKVTAYKYIVDNGGRGSIKMCAVDSATGELSGCIPTGSGFDNPADILLYTDSNNQKLAYVPSVYPTNNIIICKVSSETGALSDCTSIAPGTLSWPSTLTIVNGFSYIGNYLGGSNDVSRCQVTSSPTYLTSCSSFVAGTINPTDIKSYSIGGSDYIYVVHYATIRVCKVFSSSQSCYSASPSFSFSTPISMAISNNSAYVLNSGTNKIIKCSISASNGTLTGCTQLNPTGPASAFNFGCCSLVGITSDSSYAYLSNGSDNSVRFCKVLSDGTFDQCKFTGSGPINIPKHIY